MSSMPYATILASDAAIASELHRRLLTVTGTLPPRLVRTLQACLSRHGLWPAPPEEALGAALGQPLVGSVLWAADAATRAGTEVPKDAFLLAVEASLVGYLRFRVVDDLADEGLGKPVETLLLAGQLASRAESLVGRLAGTDETFWALHDRTWVGYGAAMCAEKDVREGQRAWDDNGIDAVAEQSLMLVLPAAALLSHVQVQELITPLVQVVRKAVQAHQIAEDVRDAGHDHEGGRITPVVARIMEAGNGDFALGSIRGAPETLLRLACARLEDAEELAEAAGFLRAKADLEQRRRAVDQLAAIARGRARFARALFGRSRQEAREH